MPMARGRRRLCAASAAGSPATAAKMRSACRPGDQGRGAWRYRHRGDPGRLGGAGLAIADVPFATLLTAIMFVLSVAQIGVSPVMFGAVIWMYWMGDTAWATFLLIWSMPVVILDNFIRPILIKRGADMPILLIFVGVIGGLLGFGLVGIFVGPVVLSVAYTLLNAWMAEDPEGTGSSVP